VSQQLGALQIHTTDTFIFISHTTNVLLFKFRCNIFNAGFGSEWDTLYFMDNCSMVLELVDAGYKETVRHMEKRTCQQFNFM